jgi:hypothetical protein
MSDSTDNTETLERRAGFIAFMIFAAFAIAIFIAFNSREKPPPPPEKVYLPKTAADFRAEEISNAFDPWDGSHIELTRWIKSQLKDPKSYEHIETRYRDKGDTVFVITKYRAKNSFGTYAAATVSANTLADGRVIEILSEH